MILWGKGLHQNSRKYDEQRLCQTGWPEANFIIQGDSGEVVGPLLSHHRCEEVALVVWSSLRSFVMPHCHKGQQAFSARPASGTGVEWRCRCGRPTGRGNDWLTVELVTSARTIPLCNCTRPSSRKFVQLIVGCHRRRDLTPHGQCFVDLVGFLSLVTYATCHYEPHNSRPNSQLTTYRGMSLS